MKHKKIFTSLIAGASVLSFAPIALIASSCNDPKKPSEFKGETKLGVKISDVASKAKDVEAKTVVEELKKAQQEKGWDQVLKVLEKYGIQYDMSQAPEKAKYSIADSTHSHEDEGMLHLGITQTVGEESKTALWSIFGFKKEEIAESYTIGNYKIYSKSSKSDVDPQDVLKELKDAYGKGFDEFLKKLQEYVKVEKIDNNDTSKFEFDFEAAEIHRHEGQIHFEKTFVVKGAKKTPAEEYVLQGLKKSH